MASVAQGLVDTLADRPGGAPYPVGAGEGSSPVVEPVVELVETVETTRLRA